MESRTHGLILEQPKTYTMNKAKYKLNDAERKNEWRWILQQEDNEQFVKAWFYFRLIKTNRKAER